jgi:hypothetical protein
MQKYRPACSSLWGSALKQNSKRILGPFYYIGLEWYYYRRALKVERNALWEHAQDRQRTQYQLHSNRLVRKINAWGKYEKMYLPIIESLQNDELLPIMKEKQTDEPFDITVWLPSKFTGRTNIEFDRRLAEIEWKLRIAEAHEALDELRHHIQIRTHIYKCKDRFTRGQAANTRALNKIETTNAKIHSSRDKYRAARSALLSLSGTLGMAGWQSQLPILSDIDVRGISEGEEGDSDGRKKLSWIWKVMGVVGGEDGDLHLRECKPILLIFIAIGINHDFVWQLFALNGASLAHVQCDSVKKSNCWKRKWSASSDFSGGKSVGGNQIVPLARARSLVHSCALKVYEPMRNVRQHCGPLSALILLIYGVIFLIMLS